MGIIVSTSSMIPIYEQIVSALKSQIAAGTLRDGDALPSVRALSNELKISALTVKKAYDELEAEGFIATVHGKGSYVKAAGSGLLHEAQLRMIETGLSELTGKARQCGITADEIRETMEIILGEYDA